QDAAWQTAQSTNTAAGYQDFLTKYPNAPTADQAREALKKLTGYQVRLASVRSKTAADKLASDLQDVVVVPPSGKSKSSEIRSAPMTESDAKAACAKLKKAHQHCEVVKSVS